MMNRSRLFSSRPALAGALLAAAAWCGGCSLLFRVDAEQCSSTGDCVARGPAFANHVCQVGTCVVAVDNKPEAGFEGGMLAEASTDSGVDASVDAAVEPRCKTVDDCQPTSPTHPEVACDVASGACIQLTTDECPFVIGDYSGKNNAQPIYIGAFAEFPSAAPTSHPSFYNYRLAINEFTNIGGIPGYNPVRPQSAGLRMPVAVVCNAAADVHVAMSHLQSDIHVPVIVAALDSVTLRSTFVNDNTSQAMMINPFGADSTLTSLMTEGLLWHMLGQPRDNAPAYSAFVPRVEAYVRTLQRLPATGGLRVATVTGNATVTQDLAEAALGVLRWNDASVDQNRLNNLYKGVAIDSVFSGNNLVNIDVSTAVGTLLAFKPNIVISFAGPEFVKLLQVLELQWATSSTNPNPFYLVGPYNSVSQSLLGWIGLGSGPVAEGRRTRVAGVGVASVADRHVLSAYENRFLSAIEGGQSSLGQENYYDAMYFAIYALEAAGRLPTLRGQDVAQGMLRLLSGPSYDMGPSDFGSIVSVLGTPGGSLSLFGTLGPPVFVRATGARLGEGSIYCVTRDSGMNEPLYAYDTLRLGPGDGGVPGLIGTFSCYGGM